MNDLDKRIIRQYLESQFNIDKIISEIERNIKEAERITDERVKHIIGIVNGYFGVNCLERIRKREVVWARQLAMVFIRELNKDERVFSLEQIGQMFPSPNTDDYLDHSSVIFATKKVNELTEIYPKNRADFEAIKQLLNENNT